MKKIIKYKKNQYYYILVLFILKETNNFILSSENYQQKWYNLLKPNYNNKILVNYTKLLQTIFICVILILKNGGHDL